MPTTKEWKNVKGNELEWDIDSVKKAYRMEDKH